MRVAVCSPTPSIAVSSSVVAEFGIYEGLVSATTDELTAIEGVGEQTATRIRDRLEGSE